MNNSILQTRDLAIGYPAGKRLGMSGNRRSGNRAKIVAEGMSLELREGELVCLLGPNGSGKSTLMRTLAGVQKPLGGEVLLSGTRLDRLSARDGARLLSLGFLLAGLTAAVGGASGWNSFWGANTIQQVLLT